MEMKYSNRSALLLPIVCAALVGACTSSDPRETASEQPAAVRNELVDTSRYLPVRKQDENGLSIPYRAAPNPYEELATKIDRQAVQDFIEARRAFSDYDFKSALELLTRLQEQHSELSGPFVLHGDVEMARADLPAAEQKYQQAVEINPLNFNAWVRLAKVQRMQGEFHRAQKTYAQALDRWPDGAELHWNLGVLYDLYLNMPERAQAHMEAYQLLSGDNSGETAAWLEEIRQRTGMQTALSARGPDGDLITPRSGNTDSDETAPTVASKSSED
jgi:tetratricopeptide (TPR) repeat protein